MIVTVYSLEFRNRPLNIPTQAKRDQIGSVRKADRALSASYRKVMLESYPSTALYFNYIRDAFERSVLDVLRQRGNVSCL
jgi:hypothetical protein